MERQHSLRTKTERHSFEPQQRLDQQSGADQQHGGQRQLGSDQEVVRSRATSNTGTAAVLEDRNQVCSRCVPRR